jgi:DNA repair photolyase
MAVEYQPYRPKRILNKHKRPDHWFWTRYTAHPYIGCQHGCEYCYWRESKYCPYPDPRDFSRLIKVKINAPQLLRKELSKSPIGVVGLGDYQPAEWRYRLSRQMLQVCLDLGFPVFVLEKSHNVLQDLELITAINAKARAVISFSIIATPESPNYAYLKDFEPAVPLPPRRFKAMEQFAKAGIVTGTAFMPILPGIYDDDDNLEAVVRWTRDHGGTFVLAGGLTLSDEQKAYFLKQLARIHAENLPLYQRLYPQGSYGPPRSYWNRLGLRIAELCQKYGLSDRMRRPIIPGEKRAANKRIAEYLADKTYRLELAGERSYKIWAYRKAAWALDELEQDVRLVYERMGAKGLESIPNVGKKLAGEIEQQILGAISGPGQSS